jgi:hypothetical protein
LEDFNDESFSFETLRALGYAPYGGADIGEVTSTASRIPDGDLTPGTQRGGRSAIGSTPTPIAAPPQGTPSAPGSPTCGAATTTGCASSTCVLTHRRPRSPRGGPALVDSFGRAAQLTNPARQRVSLPYEDTTLPGWWIPADLGDGSSQRRCSRRSPADASVPRGVRQHRGGAVLHPAARPPPGVATTCLPLAAPDKAAPFVTRSCSSARAGKLSSPPLSTGFWPARTWTPDRIELMGMSFRGLLAPRTAATEHRLAALIVYDGLYSFADAVHRMVGPEVVNLVYDGLDTSGTKANALIEDIMNSRT